MIAINTRQNSRPNVGDELSMNATRILACVTVDPRQESMMEGVSSSGHEY